MNLIRLPNDIIRPLLLFVGCMLCVSGPTSQLLAAAPNIILILTDDQGWIDTSVPMMKNRDDSRSHFLQTPQLERLARRGLVFSNAYSPAPTCTPSRCSFQFGKSPATLRQTVVHDVLATERGVDCHEEVSLAQVIKQQDSNYVTAHLGKWGFHPRTPEHAGYDVTDGNTNNGDGDYGNVRERTPLPNEDPKRIFSVTDRACQFIETQSKAKRPFFLQVSHYAAHVDHAARPETLAKWESRPRSGRFTQDPKQPNINNSSARYAAMIEDLDSSLGMLLDKLDQLQLTPDTYVIFTSDNGGGFRGNGPLRGGKANVWEGGLRVPFVVAGPKVRQNAYCDAPIAGWDLWTTFRAITAGPQTAEKSSADNDGRNLLPLWERDDKASIDPFQKRELVFHFPWYAGHPMTAIRRGDYKLVKSWNTGESLLFDLSGDISERADVSRQYPQIAADLKQRMQAYLKRVDAETIEDMRAARTRELKGYIAREVATLATTKQQLLNASPEETILIKKRQDQAKQAIRRHQEGLRQLTDARKDTRW